MKKSLCVNCKHFSPSHSSSLGDTLATTISDINMKGRSLSLRGYCRRYPIEHGKPFPEVYGVCRCGEFKKAAGREEV